VPVHPKQCAPQHTWQLRVLCGQHPTLPKNSARGSMLLPAACPQPQDQDVRKIMPTFDPRVSKILPKSDPQFRLDSIQPTKAHGSRLSPAEVTCSAAWRVGGLKQHVLLQATRVASSFADDERPMIGEIAFVYPPPPLWRPA